MENAESAVVEPPKHDKYEPGFIDIYILHVRGVFAIPHNYLPD